MQSAIDQKVVMWHMTVLFIHLLALCPHWTVEYSGLIRVGALFIIISLAPNVWHMINIHYLMNEQMNPLS